MRVDWKKEIALFHIRKRVIVACTTIAALFGVMRYFYTPEEASAVAVAYFVSLIFCLWVSTRIWLALDGVLSQWFRALWVRFESIESRLDQIIITSGGAPQQYGGGKQQRSWSQKIDIAFFYISVKVSPVCFVVAIYNLFVAYLEWRTGIFSTIGDSTALYFWLGCLAMNLFVFGVGYQLITIWEVRKKVELWEETMDRLESEPLAIRDAINRGGPKVYERKLGFYEQVERWVYKWVVVRVPA